MREQLSKSVCRDCHRNQAKDLRNPRGCDWDPTDENQWEEFHTVLCDVDEIMKDPPEYRSASTWEPPPPWCPYKLQHAVALGKEL